MLGQNVHSALSFHESNIIIAWVDSQILTKDSVTVNVDAIVQFRIRDPVASIKFINNAANATRLLAQTTLRNTLGGHTLSEILSSKDTIQNQMCVSGDDIQAE